MPIVHPSTKLMNISNELNQIFSSLLFSIDLVGALLMEHQRVSDSLLSISQ